MKGEELYRDFDRTVGLFLEQQRFRRVQPAEYERVCSEGRDRVMCDPDRRRRRFSVLLSFYPKYMEVIDELTDVHGEPRGFPCGPFLNPVGVSSSERFWSAKLESLAGSLEDVVRCLKGVGIPWLAGLRDPVRFAHAIDRVAALPAAYAHEIAGDKAKARELYAEMHRRYVGIFAPKLSERGLREFGKAYVFTCFKLGIDEERRKVFQDKLHYYPQGEAL